MKRRGHGFPGNCRPKKYSIPGNMLHCAKFTMRDNPPMPNHLANATSPYLQQHANNPVDWYPWGEQALTLAKRLNKPILLSIGYSACHWCHVMAQECFADEAVAALLNAHFVNIKVDREERPDLDQIYQSAHYFLTRRSGGWPLNMFLAPDQTPFFGGTYFPKTARYQLPGLLELIPLIADHYRKKQGEMPQLAATLTEALLATQPAAAAESMHDAPLSAALSHLKETFDPVHGGFGDAPKFPRPMEIDYLLRRYAATGDENALRMARHTLTCIAQGGLYDQIGGGFYRYSVDARWDIPHFEKMLYDNGLLVGLYVDAWRLTDDPLFRRVAEETCGWALREMQSPEGGYYSALDADSEHQEGQFYVWTREQAATLLTHREYAVAAACFGLDDPPNFEERAWHFRLIRPLDEVADALGLDNAQATATLNAAREKLFDARARRTAPGCDEKILTAWNGLMIHGMAHAAAAFGDRRWLESAQRAMDFVRGALWQDGQLRVSYKDGTAPGGAYLDDYAFLLAALLDLLQADFRAADLAFARTLADTLLDQFEDRQAGGFFFTAHSHETLLYRPKPGQDNATPSGNGMAAFALQRLGHLLGESRYLDAAERALKLFFPMALQQPTSSLTLLAALEEWLTPPQIAVLRGAAGDVTQWCTALHNGYSPHALVIAHPNGAAALPAGLAKPESETVSGWVCQGVHCLPAITELASLQKTCKAIKVI